MNSRRNIVKALCVSVCLPEMAFANTQSASKQNDAQKKAKQKIVRFADADFAAVANEYFPGATSHPRFLPISRFAVIIINNNENPVYGYALKWNLRKLDGTKESYRRTFLPGPSLRLNKRLGSFQAPLAVKSEAVLITPLFAWNSRYYNSRIDKLYKVNGLLSRRTIASSKRKSSLAAGVISRWNSGDDVGIALRAAIFSNKVVGQDALAVTKLVRSRMNAEHDEAESLLNAALNSTNTIRPEYLRERITTSISKGKRSLRVRKSEYVRARNAFARRVSFALNSGASDKVEAALRTQSARGQSKIVAIR